MPRTESSSAMSQGCLDFYWMSLAMSHLGSGLGPSSKMGQGHNFFGPTIAPQNPTARPLGRGGGFW